MNHGTLVASVIAADGGADGLGMWGMAPEASIYSYRVCEPNRECWGAYVADGIYAAIADGVNIINMSLAGPGNDDVVRAAIDDAVAHNILVVVAAGNSPPYSYVATRRSIRKS
jgi:subtilisin